MTTYRERVTPPLWVFLLTLLLVPVSLIVFLPIDLMLGWVFAAVFVAAACAALWLAAPRIRIENDHLQAGRARIPLSALGEAASFDKVGGRRLLGVEFDAAAYHSTVPWAMRLVRVEVIDESDPTTAWVLSTRKPDQLAAALRETAPA